MNLQIRQFKNINLNDPFFDSLKNDYSEFPQWFAKKAEDHAYVFYGNNGLLDGFLYLKIEDGPLNDVTPPLPPTRRLKVGTLKINAHGTKLGERFIKKIFDLAIHEQISEIYVTVFEHHSALISLFTRYGFTFRATKTTHNGTELVLIRNLFEQNNDIVSSYPLIRLNGSRTFLLSIYPKWHTRLFPDSILKNESADILHDVSHTNSIHKVYLTAMRGVETLRPGDIIVIYRTSDEAGPAKYRSVASSICVIEEYRTIDSFFSINDFLSYCRPYSVFTDLELREFWSQRRFPHIIRFTYNIALKRRVTRGEMISELGLSENKYWGFMEISHDQFLGIARKGMVDESLIIY